MFDKVGCEKCGAVWDVPKNAPTVNCPCCSIATSERNIDTGKYRWTGVKLLSSKRELELRDFHDRRNLVHDRGCVLCRGRRARRLATDLNKMFRDRDVEKVRRAIRENIADATLAVLFLSKEYAHVAQTIVRQELGIEMRPEGLEPTKR